MSSGTQVGSVRLIVLLHRRLAELLADGEWHDLEPVIRDVSKLVPPGVATRRNERDRLQASKGGKGGGPPERRVKPIEPADAVRSGARTIVRAALRGKKAPGAEGPYVIQRLADGTQQVRLHHKAKWLNSDELRAEQLRPAFNQLADHFHQMDMDYAREQVQLSAHEYGFHVSSCPEGCSLTRITKPAEAALDADEDA